MAGATDRANGQRFVLDSSVALSWCFPDEKNSAASRLLKQLRSATVAVPTLWFLEVSNALLSGERQGRLTPLESKEALALLSRLPLDVDDNAGKAFSEDILEMAREYNLTTYDASYLELAQRLSLPIATLDTKLLKAAKAMHVAVFRP